jgi:lysophospholipase L1-like esterase
MTAKANSMSRARKRWLFIALEVLAIFVALGIGEAYIRIKYPRFTMANALKYDEALFARSVLRESQDQQGLVKWPINSLGYRAETDFSVAKPPGVTRIVVIGGSSVFDPNVWGEDDWPHRVERHLNEDGHNVEVINAGVPGHATFDSVGRLYSEIWMFEPDYVVLYQCWNDIKYFTTLSPSQSLLRTYEPATDVVVDPFSGCVSKLECALVNTSQLYIFARIRYLVWKYDVGPEGAVEDRPIVDSFGETGPAQYKLNVQTFVDITRNIGATPVLTTQARLVVADNSTEDRGRISDVYAHLSHDALVEAFGTCDQITSEVAEEKNLDVLDLSSEFSGDSDLFVDHIHLTDEGSRAISEAVAEHLDGVLTEAENER